MAWHSTLKMYFQLWLNEKVMKYIYFKMRIINFSVGLPASAARLSPPYTRI